MPKVQYRIPDASYLAWLDFGEYEIEGEISNFFHSQAKVLVNPGAIFDSKATSMIRLNFATSEAVLNQAISQMSSALS